MVTIVMKVNETVVRTMHIKNVHTTSDDVANYLVEMYAEGDLLYQDFLSGFHRGRGIEELVMEGLAKLLGFDRIVE